MRGTTAPARLNKVASDGAHFLAYHRDTGWATTTAHGSGDDTFPWEGPEPTQRQMADWLRARQWTCCTRAPRDDTAALQQWLSTRPRSTP